MIDYEVRAEGLTDFTIRFEAVGGKMRNKIRHAMEEAAQAAATYMATHAPYHEGTLYRAIGVTREEGGSFGIRYRPGGAGGGGHYEIHVGVDAEQAPHAEWVIHGTGIYGEGGGNITPATGNVMVFSKLGEGDIFTAHTRGQEAQNSWFEVAEQVAEREIARQLSRL